MRISADVRFWHNVDKSTECWIWNGTKHERGYGLFWAFGKLGYASRFAYELEHGPIHDGVPLKHTCETKLCVRPSHLEPPAWYTKMKKESE